MKKLSDLLGEKTLTPAEKKKREEIAQAIEKDNPDMPMDKKMAIATATAKKVAEDKDPCWDSHEMVGMKMKNGKKVPNCVPKNEETEQLDELSHDTLHSYKRAAIKDVDKDIAAKASGNMDNKEYETKMKKRGRGMAAAQRRLTPHGTKLDISMNGDHIRKQYHEETDLEESALFKADIEGLPPTFVSGESISDVKQRLRALVKKPAEQIQDVQRVQPAQMKKYFRDILAGKEEMKEDAEHLEERNKENATKRKMMDASRGARYKASGNVVPDAEPEHKTAQAHNKAIGRALRKEDAEHFCTSCNQDPCVCGGNHVTEAFDTPEELPSQHTSSQPLKEAFADLFSFYYMSHNFHWNVKGANFPQYHEFLGDVYEEVFESIDALAEQIRVLGETPPNGLEEIVDLTNVEPVTRVVTDPNEQMTLLLEANDEVILSFYAAFDAAEEAGNEGLMNYLADAIDRHGKLGWKLESSIGQ